MRRAPGRDRRARRKAKQFADALDRRIAIGDVFRQQLVGSDAAVRIAGNDIGEGASAIDPEMPFAFAPLAAAALAAGSAVATGQDKPDLPAPPPGEWHLF